MICATEQRLDGLAMGWTISDNLLPKPQNVTVDQRYSRKLPREKQEPGKVAPTGASAWDYIVLFLTLDTEHSSRGVKIDSLGKLRDGVEECKLTRLKSGPG